MSDTVPVFRVGINPYGLVCAIGFAGEATRPLGLEGFVDLAIDAGVRSIELDLRHLCALEDDAARELAKRLIEKSIVPIVSVSPPLENIPEGVKQAKRIGAKTLRVGLTTVLEGARAKYGAQWGEMVAGVREGLCREAPLAREQGITLAIEDHQDFGSEELVAFAEEAGENVGICFDTGNPFAVGEDPLSFAKKVAPRVRHVHLKDYVVQPTSEGYRLIRCAIGDGAVPLDEIHQILSEHHSELTASLEPGALQARHIRLLTPEWWNGYPARSAQELAACWAATHRGRLNPDEEWRTPFERSCPHDETCEYELHQVQRSFANMREKGWL